MGAPERESQATHGRNSSGGRHSFEGGAKGTPAQQLRDAQQSRLEPPPSGRPEYGWNQVTSRFFTAPQQRTEQGRHRVTSPEALFIAGNAAAQAATHYREQFGNEALAKYLREKHQQLPNPTPSHLLELLAGHFARLRIEEEGVTFLRELSLNTHHIPDFFKAFSSAENIRDAVSELLGDKQNNEEALTPLAPTTIPQL